MKLEAGYGMQDTRCGMRDAGYKMRDNRGRGWDIKPDYYPLHLSPEPDKVSAVMNYCSSEGKINIPAGEFHSRIGKRGKFRGER
ncbi:MAG: hypothetical protein WCO02_17080 [Bacteroidota bacterium]